MSFRVFLHPDVNVFIKKLDKKSQRIIRNRLRTLREEPYKKGVKLTPSRYWRLRLSDRHRAIYEIDDKEKKVIVLVVDNRENIYDDFKRLL